MEARSQARSDDAWVDVSQPIESAKQCLSQAGLEKHVDSILEAIGDAESVDDLKLLTDEMVDQIVVQAGLRMVSAEKLRQLVSALRTPTAREDTAQAASGVEPERTTDESANSTADATTPPQEAIAICIDRSGSMGAPFTELTLNVVQGAVAERTRMEAVKAMFYAFRDRTETLHERHLLGLLQFDNEVETMCPLTDHLDRFESIVDDMKKRGSTAVFSAIKQGASMLAPLIASSPSIDLRLLVLTDGQSNSGCPPQEALAAANAIGAVVDAIIVGDSPDADLRKIVAATGGLCFQIRSLGEGFELLEGEAVASLRARRGGTVKPPFVPREPVEFGKIAEKAFAMASPTARPDAALLAQQVVRVTTRVAMIDVPGDATLAGASTSDGTSIATKRALLELRKVASGSKDVWLHSGDGVHIYPTENDLRVWRVLISAPKGSPFEGGTFSLSVRIPERYPLVPPNIRFEAPVPYHCNINDGGAVCLGILREDWSPALSVPKALEAIREMLGQPDTDNAMRQWIAELTLASKATNGTDTRYVDEARKRTRSEAAKSVAEWEQEWGAVRA